MVNVPNANVPIASQFAPGVPWFQFFNDLKREVDGKQAQDDLLDAVAALSMVADRYIYGTGTDTVALGTITSDWRTTLAQTPTGSHTPTLTNTTNLDASTGFTYFWFRINDTVTCFGYFEADATALATTRLGMTIPVASTFDVSRRLAGTFERQGGVASSGGVVRGDTSNNRAVFEWLASTTANSGYYFHFSYQVL